MVENENELGRAIEVKLVQFLNESFPILEKPKPVGKVTVVKFEQS
jgi:hypothetical protein